MEALTSIKPLLAILVSAGGTLLIIAFRNRPNLRETCSATAGIVKFSIVVSMIPAVLRGATLECTVFKLLPGIDIAFRVDALGLLFALGASLLWIVTTFYSIGYMRTLDEHAQTRYYACFAVALSCTMGVAFAANLFTLFLFYEGLTLSTYPLVAHKETPEARAGGRKYIIYLLGAAKVFLLTAIILTYNLTGTLDFSAGGVFSEALQAGQVRCDAAPWLAARRDGGADTGQRAAARGGGGQDRGLRSGANHAVRLWRRLSARRRSRWCFRVPGLVHDRHCLGHRPHS
jgi:multicomponent Na+:H+ antiporter subunit D